MCCQFDNTKEIKRSIYRISKLNWKWNSQRNTRPSNKARAGIS